MIVTKSTNREIHGERIYNAFKNGILTQDELKDIDLEHDQHYETLNELLRGLKKSGVEFDQVLREHAWPQEKYEIIFTVGGDGTLLHASSKLHHSQKIVPIRSSSKSVGFLCQLQKEEIQLAIQKIEDNQAKFMPIQRIQALIQRVSSKNVELSSPALNEILFASNHPASIARYQIHLSLIHI